MSERAKPTSRLPEGGVNLFQEIKAITVEVKKRGIEPIELSIGEPQGPALESARRAAAIAVLSPKRSMHGYQDDATPGADEFIQTYIDYFLPPVSTDEEREEKEQIFARRFVRGHVDIPPNADVAYLPITGIKPMLGLVPLASGSAQRRLKIATTTNPGYPTPKVWAGSYLNQDVFELPLKVGNGFICGFTGDIPADTDVLMLNYPHNPSGQIATRDWYEAVCSYCQDHDIRMFNDAAYAALSHNPRSSTLTEVAVKYPYLSWAEAFSASKLIGNGTGWRVGAMVGSTDFIGDMHRIKSNTDSGLVAPMAVGALYALEYDRLGIEENRAMYEERLRHLIDILTSNGMRLAVEPQAGFFSLWMTPKEAFGEPVANAREFNFRMIERTGIVGVHFDPYMRYAVCGDVGSVVDKIDAGFKQAAVSY